MRQRIQALYRHQCKQYIQSDTFLALAPLVQYLAYNEWHPTGAIIMISRKQYAITIIIMITISKTVSIMRMIVKHVTGRVSNVEHNAYSVRRTAYTNMMNHCSLAFDTEMVSIQNSFSDYWFWTLLTVDVDCRPEWYSYARSNIFIIQSTTRYKIQKSSDES